jgi:hypothetical protein
MNIAVTCFLTLTVVKSDTFNYDVSRGTNYGPKEWDRIQCSDVATCVRKTFVLTNYTFHPEETHFAYIVHI